MERLCHPTHQYSSIGMSNVHTTGCYWVRGFSFAIEYVNAAHVNKTMFDSRDCGGFPRRIFYKGGRTK